MRPAVLLTVFLAGGILVGGMAVGCGRIGIPRDTGVDAPGLDAPPLDVPSDVRVGDGPADVSIDAPRLDSGGDAGRDAGRDAGSDAGRDAGSDAGRDAGSDAGRDSGVDAPTAMGRTIQCSPPVTTIAAGLVCSAGFYPGFQFQITADSRLIGIGVQGSVDGSVAGSIHATVYRIGGPGVAPVLADASAVMARSLITLPTGTPAIGTASVDAILTPGWYALVTGTGAHGATAGSANLPSSGGSGCFSSPGSSFPFTVRLSDGMYILQGASPHLFVTFE